MTHIADTTINALAGIAYAYAVELNEASCRADYSELEHIARAITDKLKARLRAELEAHGPEPLVRYCPGCGSVGPVEAKYRDCCPDGGEARMIPQALAQKCHDTFRLAVDGALAAQAAPDDEDASYESMNLAVMVLSDCGYSSDFKPLLERVAGRIDRHVERLLTAQRADIPALVDELRELLQDAKRAMTELHQAAIPDESAEGVPAIIPPEAFAKFVDAHAQLCFLMHQRGHNPPKEGQRNG